MSRPLWCTKLFLGPPFNLANERWSKMRSILFFKYFLYLFVFLVLWFLFGFYVFGKIYTNINKVELKYDKALTRLKALKQRSHKTIFTLIFKLLVLLWIQLWLFWTRLSHTLSFTFSHMFLFVLFEQRSRLVNIMKSSLEKPKMSWICHH